jgi:hypothetical protein
MKMVLHNNSRIQYFAFYMLANLQSNQHKLEIVFIKNKCLPQLPN